jgi:hypothetical protein
VLLNLLSATEQFTIMFFNLVNKSDGAARNDGRPYDTGNWLNLGQVTVVWILFLAL